MEKSNNLAVLILAAGSSTRLGEPKQLLKFKSESFLKIAVKKAIDISENIFVVLGDKKVLCEKELEEFDVNIIFNKNYKNGIGSSISSAIDFLKEFENTIIMLVDQPFIPISHLKALKENIKEKSIVASMYENSISVPAIFPKKYYNSLSKLRGDKGAKSILQKENILKIDLKKEYSVDIDTKEDIDRYLK